MLTDIYDQVKYDICKFLVARDIVKLGETCRMFHIMHKEIDMDFIVKNMVSMKQMKLDRYKLLLDSLISERHTVDIRYTDSLDTLIGKLKSGRMISKEEYFRDSPEKYYFIKQLNEFRKPTDYTPPVMEICREATILLQEIRDGKLLWKSDYQRIAKRGKEEGYSVFFTRLYDWNNIWD